MINRLDIGKIRAALERAVAQYGAVDEIPCHLPKHNQIGGLVEAGLPEDLAASVDAIISQADRFDTTVADVIEEIRALAT